MTRAVLSIGLFAGAGCTTIFMNVGGYIVKARVSIPQKCNYNRRPQGVWSLDDMKRPGVQKPDLLVAPVAGLWSAKESVGPKVRLGVQKAARRSHQSIGQAETYHSLLAAQFRCLLYKAFHKTRSDILAPDRVFTWAVNRAVWLVGHFHIKFDGTDVQEVVAGVCFHGNLACFGEKVHATVQDTKTRSKVTTRWYKAVYLGRLHEMMRSVQEEAWDVRCLEATVDLQQRATTEATREGQGEVPLLAGPSPRVTNLFQQFICK